MHPLTLSGIFGSIQAQKCIILLDCIPALQLETALKFHLTHAEGLNLFTGYGDDYVIINRERITQPSLLVTPDQIVGDWKVDNFNALQAQHFNIMLEYTPELVILGTGQRLRFPHPRLSAALTNAGIGLEIMDTKAACRTFNILVAEGRRIVLGLLLTDD